MSWYYKAKPYFSELADVSNPLSLERLEVSGDPAVLQIHDAGKWLVEQGANGNHREVASFSLRDFVISQGVRCQLVEENTNGQRVNHGLEAEVDFTGANDFGNILINASEKCINYYL